MAVGGLSTVGGIEYEAKITPIVVISCIMAATGGLMFGYDIGISGGVTSMPDFLKKFFPVVYKRIQEKGLDSNYCKYDNEGLQMFTSSLYLAALIATFGASYTTRSLGRRLTMLIAGIFFIIGTILNAAAINFLMLVLGRLMLGCSVGFANRSILKPPLQFTRSVASTTSSSSHCLSTGTGIKDSLECRVQLLFCFEENELRVILLFLMLRFKLKNLLKGILNYLRISRKILKVMGGLLIVSIWIFPPSSLSLAEKGLRELSGVNVELENLDPLVHRAIAATSAVPDLRDRYDKIPTSIESKLLPFQRDGVRFILQHGGRVLLADEMGLGKTLQAIAVASCVRESWPVLILTPSSLRLHWASTIQQWLNIPSSDILVVLSQCSGSNKSGFTIVSSSTKGTIHLDGLFNIISYDVVPKLQNLLMASEFKVVIADESHFLKNAQAKRTTASLPVIKKAQYALLLSGTPALSRPIELFKQLEALYPDVFKNVHEYGNRYCKGGVFGMYQGASNHEELHNLIKATLMIRRLKKDVLSELPMKRRQQVFLDLAEKDMKQVNALFRELEVLKRKIKACNSKEEVDTLKFSEKNLINKIYTESAEAKIPAVLEYLATMVEAGCKFLIFAHHQPMIDSIHQFLLKKKVDCIRIDGHTPAASRQALVTDFQEKDSVKAAVLSIRAGGVGLTLTAASTVVFAELSWTPGDLIQAEDRAHRIGQASSVNVYYLLANDTVDDIIWDVVQSKLENLGQMLDGHENTMKVAANQPKSSPSKQKTVNSSSQPKSSPSKQNTLDSFIKRCNNTSDHESEPKLKYHRQ